MGCNLSFFLRCESSRCDKNRLTFEEKAFGMLAEAGKGNATDNPSEGDG